MTPLYLDKTTTTAGARFTRRATKLGTLTAIAILTAAQAWAIDYNSGGIVTVSSGDAGDVTVSNGTTVNFGGTAAMDSASVLDTSTLNVNGGAYDRLSIGADDSSSVHWLGGHDTKTLTISANENSGADASISISGGSTDEGLDIYSGRSLSFSGGNFPQTEAYVGYYYPNSDAITADFTGGSHSEFYVYTGSDTGATPDTTVNITDGAYPYAEFYPGYYDDPTPEINISGGTWGEFYIYNGGDDGLSDSTVNITGGSFEYAEIYPGYYQDDATINIEGGTFGELYFYTGGDGPSVTEVAVNISQDATFNGETTFDLGYYGDSAGLTIDGGVFNEAVVIDAKNESLVTILSGRFNSDLTVNATGQSEVLVYGGQLGTTFGITEDANVTFYGTEFFLNGVAVPFGTLDLTSFGGTASLSGTLSDGSVFSDDQLTDNGTGSFKLVFQLAVVPEPGSLALLMAAACSLTTRCRRFA